MWKAIKEEWAMIDTVLGLTEDQQYLLNITDDEKREIDTIIEDTPVWKLIGFSRSDERIKRIAKLRWVSPEWDEDKVVAREMERISK